jgi:predicted nucleic acid-binding protein
LHKGELTTFLIALLDYELKGRPYYYVTDDKKMRTSIPKILKDSLFIKKLGCSVQEVKYTGTIGLIKRLKLRNLITEEDINNIADELEQSTFRISPELIEELRGC